MAKLDFPRYNGMDDPTSWIYRVEQFFDYKQIEDGGEITLGYLASRRVSTDVVPIIQRK